MWRLIAARLAVIIQLAVVRSHRPLLTKSSCDGDFGSSNTGLFIPDPTLSWSYTHYLDCTSKAVWMHWVNPTPNQTFYIGVGTPPMPRHADLRADALVIGPGLPQLTAAEKQLIPAEVLADPVWNISGMGAILHRSPADQSTCAHLGTVMQAASTVVNGRCDFWEEWGQTNDWRVLDADYNKLPEASATYYAAVFLQEDTSGKVGIAVGTWVEDFVAPHPIVTPSCERILTDWSEKEGNQTNCLPVTSCASLTSPIPKTDCTRSAACTPTSCEDTILEDAVCTQGNQCDCQNLIQGAIAAIPGVSTTLDACGSEVQTPGGSVKIHDVCAKSCECTKPLEFCGDFIKGNAMCTFGNSCDCNEVMADYPCGSTIMSAMGNVAVNDVCAKSCGTCPPKMLCGGDRCSSAFELWQKAAMQMHMGMAIEFTCDANLDFVHGMIPHHEGALKMCEVLLKHLMCPETQDMGGLVHFCGHVKLEQEREVAAMKAWLASKPDAAAAVTCNQSGSEMKMGCGDMSCESSKAFMMANHEMHMGMMIDLSCEHDVDFVRGMIPHHAGAVLMCQILSNVTAASPDAFLMELCDNITRLQYAEIAFMSQWLLARGKPVSATCETCNMPMQPEPPCEDTLPTSSFCHTIGGDLNCKCDVAVATYPCGQVTEIRGFGNFNTTAECMRTCGHCPAERPPLFHKPCGKMGDGHNHNNNMGDDDHDGHDHHKHHDVDAASASSSVKFAAASLTLCAIFSTAFA